MNEKYTYETFKKIIDKTVVNKCKKMFGVASSLKFKDRFVGCLIMLFIFIPMLYADNMIMQEAGQSSAGDIHIVSLSTAKALSAVSKYTTSIFTTTLVILFALGFLNLFPKKNLTHQMLFGTIFVAWFGVSVIVALLTMLFGATLGAFGKVGVCLQTLLVIYLLFVSIKKRISELKYFTFGSEPFKGWKTITTISVALVIVITLFNHFTLRLGYSSFDTTFTELLTGWGMLVWGLVLIGFIKIIYKQIFISFYLVKYDDKFHSDLDFTDEEWYGKRKAKRIQKKREKKGEVK